MTTTAHAGIVLCSVEVEGQQFGLDTRQVREVLGHCPVQPVPLSPDYIAGVVTYRGDVLTTVSLRVVLGFKKPQKGSKGCVVVIEGAANGEGAAEQFGLQVDDAGVVVPAGEDLLRANPPALSEIYRALCCGAFRGPRGLVVQLDPEELKPVRLGRRSVARGLLHAANGVGSTGRGASECEH